MKEQIPSLAEMGGHQLYPADPSIGMSSCSPAWQGKLTARMFFEDRRPALLTILKSILVSYSHLLSALLAPPPTASSTAPPDYLRHVEWIAVMSQNIMAAANDMRPVQVLCYTRLQIG